MHSLLQMSTLKQVLEEGPCERPIKVKVVARGDILTYQKDGQERQSLHCAVADNEEAARTVIYDQTQFRRFEEGSSVTLRNIIVRAQQLMVTRNTRCYTIYPLTHQLYQSVAQKFSISYTLHY